MTPDRFKDGIQWWMDTTRPMSEALFPNPPQWHIDTGNLVRLVPQRPWVGLTGEERDMFIYIDEKDKRRFRKYGEYIEQLLKEKNA
jgi:hypothetical protein